MDEQRFIDFLKKNRRSDSAIQRCVAYVQAFERYLSEHRQGRTLGEASPDDLEEFVLWLESGSKSAKTHLWAICIYYEHTADQAMRAVAGALRKQRIEKAPFPLKEFRGVSPDHVEKLAAVGITDVNKMLEAGRTRDGRQALSERTGVPLEAIVEFVKLSDLSRIPGVKGIRARLYYDAGVDTLDKIAEWEPEELREMLTAFVEKTGFEGIAPWLKEAAFSVKTARQLPGMVEY